MTEWYADGLSFSCTQCGNCCTGPSGYVWMPRRDLEAIADYLGLSHDEFTQRYTRLVGDRLALVDQHGGDCIFLTEDRQCSIQPVKPRQCRTYPFWPRLVASRKNWQEESESCPGIGGGARYTQAEIDAIMNREASRESICRIFRSKRE